MTNRLLKLVGLLVGLLVLLGACTDQPEPAIPADTALVTQTSMDVSVPTATPIPERALSICMGDEPDSLFLYGDDSLAARNVRQAIYDGPVDVLDFQPTAVILEKVPSLTDGDVFLEVVEVQPGDLILDANGELTELRQGVAYFPSGCRDVSCAQVLGEQDRVAMDQLIVRYKFRQGISWSDGAPLTADDSLFSYEVARDLYPRARSRLLAHTASYTALDESTVEWRGIPGYMDPQYALNFFTPLPRHAWGDVSSQDLLSAEISTRSPLGWGAYIIQSWEPGVAISLVRNPAYFRGSEGLPLFNQLEFRFMEGADAGLAALKAGDCDVLDETFDFQQLAVELAQQAESGTLALQVGQGGAWEHIDFGISSLNPARLPFFQSRETRQAFALCIDRQSIVDQLTDGLSPIPNTFSHPSHPATSQDVQSYSFDPRRGAELFQAQGWVDTDADPQTPRLAQGVNGVPDGTPLQVGYIIINDPEAQRVADIIQASLQQCGVELQFEYLGEQVLFAAGPSGPLFGRDFDLAQYAWQYGLEPSCELYTTAQIPGPYPEYSRGWGGANASGYSNPDYDRACQAALNTLPDMPDYLQAHHQAQVIFAEDLPAIPLYLRSKRLVTRTDLCGLAVTPITPGSFWNLEAWNYGVGCED